MSIFINIAIPSIALSSSIALAGPASIFTDRDYMTSGFFSFDPLVRGDNDGRGNNRVSSQSPFGTFNENTYLEFNDFDWSAISGPVDQAIFRIGVSSGGFGADSSSENPFDISVHSLSSDPWTAIDHSATSGEGFYQNFVNDQINFDSIVSTTQVTGVGVYDWDITALVNEWIANGDSNLAFTIALSGIADTSGGTFLQGLTNSTSPTLGEEDTIGQIVLVPSPGISIVLGGFGIFAVRRRR